MQGGVLALSTAALLVWVFCVLVHLACVRMPVCVCRGRGCIHVSALGEGGVNPFECGFESVIWWCMRIPISPLRAQHLG